jgi:hypothetical protein
MRRSFPVLIAIFLCAISAIAAGLQPTGSSVKFGPSESPAIGVGSPALSVATITDHLTEAKQMLQSTPSPSSDSVKLAVLDPDSAQLSVFTLPKDQFLTKDADLTSTTQFDRSVRIHVMRANGVNTAVTVSDSTSGKSLVPLLVQYPIVKQNKVTEVAFYTSVHPALLSPDVTSAGQAYVRTLLEQAAEELADQGVHISGDIVDIAEHLCIVEHTDHKRFLNEKPADLFPEVLSLYALNQGDTFRYSVSTAGAGGMIQMIPRTYEGIRENHSNISLTPDFVTGMRDHENALKAMLLYMNDTWKVLASSNEVQDAVRTGIATKPELLAAGYNSNPLRLPGYLKNGGSAWRTLIPAETQMYLSIYSSVDNTISFPGNASQDNHLFSTASLSFSNGRTNSVPLVSWIGARILNGLAISLLR